MIKRTMVAALLGLAVGSQAVVAQDMKSPAPPDSNRTVQQQPVSPEQQRAVEQKYWATHNDDAPSYPLNP